MIGHFRNGWLWGRTPEAGYGKTDFAPRKAKGAEASKEEEKPKATTHESAPKLDLKFWDQMAPKAGEGKAVRLTEDEVTSVLSDGQYGLISAGKNPNDEEDSKLTPEDAGKRHEQLRQDLENAGYKFVEVRGKYGEEEPSFLVMAADRGELQKLGKKYKQDSVIYGDAGTQEMLFTSGGKSESAHFGEGWSAVPDASDYYTEVPLQGGKKLKFSLNFDFGAKHEAPEKEWETRRTKKTKKAG